MDIKCPVLVYMLKLSIVTIKIQKIIKKPIEDKDDETITYRTHAI